MLIRWIRIRIRIVERAMSPEPATQLAAVQVDKSVFRIHDILVRIRIRGSMPLTNGSGSGSGSMPLINRSESAFGSGSGYFRH
jgi:hypothetical protein